MRRTPTVPLSDTELQQDILAELDWEPSIDAANIGVTVRGGVVTLTGTVNSYLEKKAAERVVKRVFGVKGLAEELKVKLPDLSRRTDSHIAQAAIAVLEAHAAVPSERIMIMVEAGILTLEGEVDTNAERFSAEKAVQQLAGVKLVRNDLTLRPQPASPDLKDKVRPALKRRADIDATSIQVEALEGRVILSGAVRSLLEKELAVRVAKSAPGVLSVDDKLEVLGA